jgi:hypothetical protein
VAGIWSLSFEWFVWFVLFSWLNQTDASRFTNDGLPLREPHLTAVKSHNGADTFFGPISSVSVLLPFRPQLFLREGLSLHIKSL